jgi:hypothetical protein
MYIIGDLWHLTAPTKEINVWEYLESMEEELTVITPTYNVHALEANGHSYVKGCRCGACMGWPKTTSK